MPYHRDVADAVKAILAREVVTPKRGSRAVLLVGVAVAALSGVQLVWFLMLPVAMEAPQLPETPVAEQVSDKVQTLTVEGTAPSGDAVGDAQPASDEVGPDNGDRSVEEIVRVIEARAGVFKACFDWELNRQGKLAGKIFERIVIDSSGRVTVARRMARSSLVDDRLQGCIDSNMRRLRFRAGAAQSAVVYPMTFSGTAPTSRDPDRDACSGVGLSHILN